MPARGKGAAPGGAGEVGMFNSNRGGRDTAAVAQSASGARGSAMFSVLGSDVSITGNIQAESELHIDGRVEGDVTCSTLAQGAGSRINGSVTADTARIAGTIEGSVRAKTLTVERTARIVGDVEYEAITIESGGHVDGRLKRVGTAADGAGGDAPL